MYSGKKGTRQGLNCYRLTCTLSDEIKIIDLWMTFKVTDNQYGRAGWAILATAGLLVIIL